ncbi:GntR family transcriptional regulator [Corynebacterium sp. P5848]|uniref:GntR family transcriptional regulator n=1 Tax=Corynebacterium marambiense TaxID=2765364 RepID=UPI002260A94F|nr:GntR family transcriptional regulator [Corynebacterium marambiense]MCX7542582.1 GntR family transcriptional regulator [Corynebacterium marambiense]
MLITLDTSSPVPVYTQLVAALTRSITDGETPAGARLPSAGELAEALDLNRNTVLRAYRQLRDQGLVELRRGKGATVLRPPERITAVENALDALARLARESGVSLDQLAASLAARGVTG